MTTAKTWIVTTFAISLFCMAAEPLAAQQDPTGGVDESNIFTSKSLLEIIRNGGPMMIPIGIASILLLVFVFERITSLRRGRIIPRHSGSATAQTGTPRRSATRAVLAPCSHMPAT